MKLTEDQKEELHKYGWDVITNMVDNEEQNCGWVNFTAEDDGHVFSEVVKSFGLTGDSGSVSLLVIGTSDE